MRNILILGALAAALFITPLLADEWLTIYNDDLALVRTQASLPLEKGDQYYNYDNITSRIRTESVIVTSLSDPKTGNVTVAEQNYEYDLAGTEAILAKYIDRDVTLTTKNASTYTGKMKFYDGSNIGLLDSGTQKLNLIYRNDIQQMQLAELPSNFYTKPTLRWRLITDKKASYPIQITYLTGGLSWVVTYNATWDGTKLGLNAWVTIDNHSGKGFDNVNLKMIAGDVNQIRQAYDNYAGRGIMVEKAMNSEAPVPSFEEKAFHDFHMYTLSQPVSFADKQIKQLQLFPYKNVTAKTVYEYTTNTDGVMSKIKFKNTEENGLGIPLPKGTFKIYKQDTDKNLEFIGEDSIDHTGKNEEVSITTGKAFDLVGKTQTRNTRSIGNNGRENDMVITLRNNSKEEKTIRVVHPRNPSSAINKTGESLPHELNADNQYIWMVTLAPDKEYNLTFTERFTY